METTNKLRSLFKNQNLLDQALTHRSWVNENQNKRGSNERLEFLGDAILEFIVSEEIYEKLPNKEEGYLTALRASLVNTQNLAEVAKGLDLGEAIFMSKGEIEGGGRNNPSLLADTTEAIIGAIFLDQGIEMARDFIKTNILHDLEKRSKMPLKDPKSRLQEKVQAQGFPTPKYKVTKEEGPDHAKTFEVEVLVSGKVVGKGEGRSKSDAEQDAARSALQEG